MKKDRLELPAPSDLERLKAENALLRDAFGRLPQGLCAFDGQDRLLLANARYREIWSLPEYAVRPGTTLAEIMEHTLGCETEHSRSQPRLEPGSEGTRKREWTLDDGRVVEVVVSRRADGSCIALCEDVTELRDAHLRIAFLARHDLLTQLPNRAVLHEELDRAFMHVARGGELALLCLNLDRFKPVNDSFGHAVGDELLRQVAARLRACARSSDLVVCLAGDEFAIVQAGAQQPTSATVLAGRIIDSLSSVFDLDGQPVHISTSVGVAVAPFDGADAMSLLRSADLAMYRAKSDGRGTLRFFEPKMDADMRPRRNLEADLRLALERGEFELAYQPQVNAASHVVCGVEALLRWRHPQLGVVSPLDFIGLAEDTRLIIPIGRWVLEQACRDAMMWPASVRVAINVSAVQFRHGSLLRDVLGALQLSGLPASRLELEITESVILADAQQALSTLREVHSLGVQVALDDFGTGYSSVSYLRDFPFDRIKIDRSFVRDVDTSSVTQAIIRAVVELSHSLGMSTTVEGIETPQQLQIVQQLGCTEVQGYLVGRPCTAAEIVEVIRKLSLTAAEEP
ncbi:MULTISPECIES: EAL domain-containing protein [unclassified Marinobacter]|jgi:diguanylate cyclase (GGDEF)-like protein|uniref:putative bifunctional diguanylate cyclase/phosphodiesterase n=1 Tax=unclassified Marinobacter TaxID=83889 RepID=UPI00200DBB96|nr:MULTISPECIES: EAL domain-containing protein [unclassified Marinobacter]UQG56779.1 EAL domain-containing protein [Marinobacter sp. M4C]UQG65583.1 EAL domain-containing protein [Marinobacter sp. M2C]UQG69863.1 EAL domain-containing protein [Marinobacter sp. M1C]